MRKFEKLPESKVIFTADVAVLGSKVPDSESSLMQCLAGEGWWEGKARHLDSAIEICCAGLARHGQVRPLERSSIVLYRKCFVNQWVPRMDLQLIISRQSL